MTKQQMIAKVWAAYPYGDEYVDRTVADITAGKIGDGLLTFAVNEAISLYDPALSEEEMLEEVARALSKAAEELQETAEFLTAGYRDAAE